MYNIYNMFEVAVQPNSLRFSDNTPDTKIAPIFVSGAVFLGKAAVGGAVGAAASWGTTRFLDNRFPQRNK
jgi:hypothetical protein